MNLKLSYIRLYNFITIKIWQLKKEETSKIKYFFISLLKIFILAAEFTTERRITSAAAALTYSTLLAIVPILAVVFAIARGFGYSKYIEQWFRESLSSQPQAAEIIIGFVNSYLIHTKSGMFLGIGLIFMLFTVIMLISNIEQTFNIIWQVKKPRSLFRTITDYSSMFLLAPIIIVVTSGISIFFATIFKNIEGTMLIGPIMQTCIQLMPYILMSTVFTTLYIFMPNTKVKLSCAIGPGIMSGVAMQGLQLFYIHSQIWVSSYNAIYGSFAALPLFMLWIQISWLICLFGAELCYANQNMEDFSFRAKTEDISQRYRTIICIVLTSIICKRFANGKKPYSALELKIRTGFPIRIINELLYELVKINILTETANEEKERMPNYQPAECLSRLSVGVLLDRIESYGKWTPNIDTKILLSPEWKRIIERHTKYLKQQRDVLLKDL